MKYNFRIKTIAGLYVLAILILIVFSYNTNREALTLIKGQFSEQQLFLAKHVAESIEEEFESFASGLELLNDIFDPYDDPSLKTFRNTMRKVYDVFNCTCVQELAFIDDKGVLRISVLKSNQEGTDYSAQPCFLKAKASKKGDIFVEYHKGSGVNASQNYQIIAKPFMDPGGNFLGMVRYTIHVDALVSCFMPYNVSGSRSCVIDKEGSILSESSNLTFDVISRDKKRDSVFKGLIAELKPGTVYSGEYVLEQGEKFSIVSVPVRIADQVFSMIISTPEQEYRKLLAPFSREYAIIIIMVIGAPIGASLFVIYLMSKWNMQLNRVVEERTKNLSRSEKNQRILLETINEVFWETDADGRYTYISPGSLLIFGYLPEELMQTSMYSYMPDKTAKEFREKISEHAHSRKPFANLERINLHKNGKEITLATNGTPLFDDEEKLKGFRGADRDITQQKNAEQGLQQYADQLEQVRSSLENKVEERTRELKDAHVKLVRKERASVLGQLSIAVSHELRNPLGVISNAIYYFNMKKDLFEDPVVRENIDIISREIKTANKIITDILNFSRNSTPVRLESNINQLVQEMLLRAATPDKIHVVTVFDEDIPPVAVDPTQVAQIFLNLLENAVDAMEHEGTIWVATRLFEKTVRVIFVDDGPGISENDLENIFEPLFTTRAKGIGLGLAIAKNLADVNNAEISVRSRKGEGAVFIVTFFLKNGEPDRC